MANALRHNYRAILTYNPVTNEIGECKFLGENYLFRGDLITTVYLSVRKRMDTTKEIVLGVSLLKDFYQLSERKKGYIKEDDYTPRNIDRGRFLYALAQKAKEMGADIEW